MIKISVIGAGAMGSGIAQVAATAGHEVMLYDAFPGAIIKARDSIQQSLTRLASKNVITHQSSVAAFGRIFFINELQSIAEADLVIEAIIEDFEEKEKLLSSIADFLNKEAIVATNTSSLSVTAMASLVHDPGRFIGIHFFNPPVLMKLVEIIPALQTDEAVVRQVNALIKSWGKTPVIAKDTPGFIVNRIARPYYSEALRMVEENMATVEEVDTVMRRSGFKMGPFELMDFIGHDVNAAVTRSVWTAMHFDPRYKPSHLQANLVRAGWLGRKSGRGFYQHDHPVSFDQVIDEDKASTIRNRILIMLINEAADALYYGIASKEDIELAITSGVNYPKGLLGWADELGIADCVRMMDDLFNLYHEERYRCSVLLRNMADNETTFFG